MIFQPLQDSTTIALVIGGFGVVAGMVNQLSKWGIESLKTRHHLPPSTGRSNGRTNGKGFTSADHLLLTQAHEAAVDTDRKLDGLIATLNLQLERGLEESRNQTELLEMMHSSLTAKDRRQVETEPPNGTERRR